MNMTSASVSVTVNDQSIYAAPNPRTIPLIVVATRANKISSDGAATAPGTIESGQVRLITSQRDLLLNYGNPVFVLSDGEPVHGDETNEYALLAAHTFLGRGSRAYILRADIDLGELIPNDQEPVEPAPDGTYWVDADSVVGGIFVRSAGVFTPITSTNDFTVFTTPPTTADGVDGDWGFDYSTADGTIVYKFGGTWKPATDTNLAVDFGASTNLHASPTTPIGGTVQDGDFWFKTVSSGGGVNLQLRRFRAADGVWVTQTVLRQSTMPVPNQNTIWEDISATTTTGTRPLFIGTGLTFIPLPVFVQNDAPVAEPENGTLWFDDSMTDFALYLEGTNVGFGNQWVPITTTTVSNPTSTEKVISGSPPQFPAQGAVWVDTSTPEARDNYPLIKRFVGIDWIDIRASVIFSSEDPVAPGVLNGTFWCNTGESKTRNTVKTYNPDFEAVTVVLQAGSYVVVPQTGNFWEPNVGDKFGRVGQRDLVVEALQEQFVANQQIRAESIYFQLIAAPGYPELYDEMVTLNSDNNEVSFVVCDVPKFMVPDGIPTGREVTAAEWITNANNVASTGERGFAAGGNSYAGFWYPWCLTTNLDGEDVFQPASHIALRTIAFSDSVSAPWFPPAGFQRGRVDNATSVGHLSNEGTYTPLILTKSQRDVLYENRLNPIAFLPQRGLTVFGQKTNQGFASALDRVNVSRLIAKMRYDLARLLEPFLFELNDAITRRSAQITTERYLAGLKSLRALFDFAVRCDESNNTPDRIDRNEMYVDVAIKPTKAVEFIFVPITVLNTGDDLPF
jgi:hypothetical protein